ncbi:unnamed protein product [Lactuca saligna]|uniref:Uncharacterized protein n=1 Tax=Lactuca saligna TaxID=75948 RepID=A0AA36EBQ8_LACSI|nr:unnamed protein product [Lactuca saligna]
MLDIFSIMKALTMVDKVPLVHLSRAYSSSIYNLQDEVISFKLSNNKTSINKPNLYKLIGIVPPEIHTSRILVNAYDAGGNVKIAETSKYDPSTDTPIHEDEEILFGDDQDNFTDFFFSPFVINLSDDDDATIMKGKFKKLNEKLNEILEHSNAFSSIK